MTRRKLAWSTAIPPGRALFDPPDDLSVNQPSALLNGPVARSHMAPGPSSFPSGRPLQALRHHINRARQVAGLPHPKLEEITAVRLPALVSLFAYGWMTLALRSLTCASGEEFPPEILRQKVE